MSARRVALEIRATVIETNSDGDGFTFVPVHKFSNTRMVDLEANLLSQNRVWDLELETAAFEVRREVLTWLAENPMKITKER